MEFDIHSPKITYPWQRSSFITIQSCLYKYLDTWSFFHNLHQLAVYAPPPLPQEGLVEVARPPEIFSSMGSNRHLSQTRMDHTLSYLIIRF